MMNERAAAAASELEDLAIILNQLIIDLRSDRTHSKELRMYWFRRRLTKIINAHTPPMTLTLRASLEFSAEYYKLVKESK